MQVTVLFFAAARDATGRSKYSADLPSHVTTVGTFLEWLRVEFPTLEPYLESLRIARNEEFAPNEACLGSGDVLAVIPPVAGG
jgi:molybdopterin converting factor subunit 1